MQIDKTPARYCRACGAFAAIGEWREGICVICRDKQDRGANESSNPGHSVVEGDTTPRDT